MDIEGGEAVTVARGAHVRRGRIGGAQDRWPRTGSDPSWRTSYERGAEYVNALLPNTGFRTVDYGMDGYIPGPGPQERLRRVAGDVAPQVRENVALVKR